MAATTAAHTAHCNLPILSCQSLLGLDQGLKVFFILNLNSSIMSTLKSRFSIDVYSDSRPVSTWQAIWITVPCPSSVRAQKFRECNNCPKGVRVVGDQLQDLNANFTLGSFRQSKFPTLHAKTAAV